MKITKWLLVLTLMVSTAHASGTRTLDGAVITNGAATLTLSTTTGSVPAFTPTNHGVVISGSAAAATVTSAGTSGQVLTSNGAAADPTFQAVPSSSPTVNNTNNSPQSITAGTGIVLAAPTGFNVVYVIGNGGAVTVTSTGAISACTADGQRLIVFGSDDTNSVKLNDIATDVNSGLRLNGPWTGKNYSALELVCVFEQGTAFKWWEVARR